MLQNEMIKGPIKIQNQKKGKNLENVYEDQQLQMEPKIKSHMKILPVEQIE